MEVHVTMVTYRITLLMNKLANMVMDDEWVHSLDKPFLLFSATSDEVLSWMIETWVIYHLVSDSNCNTINLQYPNFLLGMTLTYVIQQMSNQDE